MQCSVHTFDCTVRAAANGSSVNPRRHAFSSLCVGSAEDAAREPDLVVDWEGALRRAAAQQAHMAQQPAAGGAAAEGGGAGGGRRELGERRQQQAGVGGIRTGVWTAGAGSGGAAGGVTHHVPHGVLIAKIDIEVRGMGVVLRSRGAIASRAGSGARSGTPTASPRDVGPVRVRPGTPTASVAVPPAHIPMWRGCPAAGF